MRPGELLSLVLCSVLVDCPRDSFQRRQRQGDGWVQRRTLELARTPYTRTNHKGTLHGCCSSARGEASAGPAASRRARCVFGLVRQRSGSLGLSSIVLELLPIMARDGSLLQRYWRPRAGFWVAAVATAGGATAVLAAMAVADRGLQGLEDSGAEGSNS